MLEDERRVVGDGRYYRQNRGIHQHQTLVNRHGAAVPLGEHGQCCLLAILVDEWCARLESTYLSRAASMQLVLDAEGSLTWGPAKIDLAGISTVVAETEPDVIAIDSPPVWGLEGKARPIERQLQALGVNIFATPTDPGDHGFYRWMVVGFRVFEVAGALGYDLYRGGPARPGFAIEVFPHASAVALRGTLPVRGTAKNVWRRAALEAEGIATDDLRTVDELDAALAALTGIRFVQGRYCVVGTPESAVLVLPVLELPSRSLRSRPGPRDDCRTSCPDGAHKADRRR